MYYELIKTSDNRILGAQVGHHHIGKSAGETDQEFLRRVKLFVENIDHLKTGGQK